MPSNTPRRTAQRSSTCADSTRRHSTAAAPPFGDRLVQSSLRPDAFRGSWFGQVGGCAKGLNLHEGVRNFVCEA